jgi:hypothetical protein
VTLGQADTAEALAQTGDERQCCGPLNSRSGTNFLILTTGARFVSPGGRMGPMGPDFLESLTLNK